MFIYNYSCTRSLFVKATLCFEVLEGFSLTCCFVIFKVCIDSNS